MKRTTTAAPLHPTASTFNHEVLQSDVPVLIDFWAPWCPPCTMLKPELERLAAELGGVAKVALINVDEEPELARMFRINSIPALMIVKNGQPVDAWTGFAPRTAILQRIARHLDNSRSVVGR